MITLPLTQGYNALVDASDYPAVSGYTWYAVLHPRGQIYASRDVRQEDGTHSSRCLSHEILGVGNDALVRLLTPPSGYTLDYRRSNLRISDRSEIGGTRRSNRNSRSPYKGVSPIGDRWRARIRVRGETYWLGLFDVEEEAALAYDRAALQLRTDPVLNFTKRDTVAQAEKSILAALFAEGEKR